MDDATTAPATPDHTPVPNDGLDVLTRKLIDGKSAADAAKIVAMRKAKVAAKPISAADATPATPTPTVTEPDSLDDDGSTVLDFSGDTDPQAAPEPSEPVALTDAELALLSEKARKQYLDANKEAAKVRKRAQEAEAKLAAEQASVTKAAEEIANLKSELDKRSSTGALSFNVYGTIPATQEGASTVEAYANNAKEAMKKLQLRAMGKEDPELLNHKFPDGEERELTADDVDELQQRIDDASAWKSFQEETAASRQRSAAVISMLEEKAQGYKEAYAAIQRGNAQTQLPELMAKAALYDALVKGKGRIIFPGSASAATNAEPSARSDGQTRKSATQPPPKETAGTNPRMVPEGSGGGTERSALKQRAMKSGKPEDIKAAIMAIKPR